MINVLYEDAGGFLVENASSVSPACRKRRPNGAMYRNQRVTRHVFVKHGCPRWQQMQNMAKISKSYILTRPIPGACDVSEV